jgi:predicted alpha/beta-hydrolase family hydrolase
MRHAFMEKLAHELAEAEVATLRYQFPYMQQGRSRPDPPAVLTATVRAAIAAAVEAAPDLSLLAGGKSLGGRMTSHAFSEPAPTGIFDVIRRVRGLSFFGFPLHPPGRPGTERGEHLHCVKVPMLFLQGTRDTLADLTLLGPLCAKLAPRATLHIVNGTDHAFHVLKRSGTTNEDVLRRLARITASWADLLA